MRLLRLPLLSLFIILNFSTVCVALEPNNFELEAINVLHPTKRIITAGQPTSKDIVRLKEAGVTVVINLRPESEEIDFDEKSIVESLGISYINIPVHGAKGITKENAKILDEILEKNQGESFVHCGSGNRVGGIFAMRAFHFQEKNIDESIQIGKEFGLTTLAASVRSSLLKIQIQEESQKIEIENRSISE